MGEKFQFYEHYGVEEYYIYDPDDGLLEAWMRHADRLEAIPQVAGFVSPRLGIRFDPGKGADNLRILGPDGTPFLTFTEWVEKSKADQRRANSAEDRVREQAKLALTEPISSRRMPCPSRMPCRAASTRRRNLGSFTKTILEPIVFGAKADQHPGRLTVPGNHDVLGLGETQVLREIILHFRERNRLHRLSYLFEPCIRISFRDDRQDLDRVAFDVVEDPQVIDAQPILRMGQLPKTLDSALADFGRLVPQVDLHRVTHLGSFECAKRRRSL